MNYLAHLLLSGNDENIIVGNFIGDHVKGKRMYEYPEGIVKGIKLHRLIDAYTDSHSDVLHGKELLYGYCGKYAPVALDILFDHFLAINWQHYHPDELAVFSEKIYAVLDVKLSMMPEKTKHMFHYMKRDNWLEGYARMQGIENALYGLSRRTSSPGQLYRSVEALKNHYEEFGKVFSAFFPQLKQYSKTTLELL